MLSRSWMVSIAIVSAFASTAMPQVSRAANEVTEEPFQLIDLIERDGLLAVGQRSDLSAKQRQLVRLVAQLLEPTRDANLPTVAESEVDAASEFSVAAGETFATVSSRQISAQQLYSVTVGDDTYTTTFSEIVIFYQRSDGSLGQVSRYNVAPGQIRVFGLAECSVMTGYVVGFFVDTTLVLRLPSSGVMTPELASQLNPTDVYPCSDS